MKITTVAMFFVLALLSEIAAGEDARVVWLEAEQFKDTGRWSNDSQHVDLMGSPYLLATGVGKAVEDAVTTARVPAAGEYRLWVRCRDWLPGHSPGRFQVMVGGKAAGATFGRADGDAWRWVDGGTFRLAAGDVELRLRDLTGWWGRCDAVALASGTFKPANNIKKLAEQRLRYCDSTAAAVENLGPYDVVVVGGGPAGIGAALSAARNGCKVALVQDRPVLGGNSSSEISIPPMGYIGNPPDRINVTGIADEIFPKQGWHNFADPKKIDRIIRAEKNISLFLNTRATGVEMHDPTRVKSVLAANVRDGRRMAFSAPRFVDCTGHGWIGYYAGAEHRMGQEARAEFGESLAPVEPGKRTMGNSLYKAVIKDHGSDQAGAPDVPFKCPVWAYQWKKASDFETDGHKRIKAIRRPSNFDVPSRGKGRSPGNSIDGSITYSWWIEYGGMLDTINDAERIRDELFRITLGMWNYAKNHNPKTVEKNRTRELVWMNYVPGVRESRRLMGDYIMTQRDFDEKIVHPDTVAFSDWGIDVHHPEGFWVKGNDAIHVYMGRRTSIPYRSLYSKNIQNLFMAGRCHSATHIALGGTRVMRPMCATGQAAGTAAAIARRHATSPRGVYEKHIIELQQTLLKDGCYLLGVKNRDPGDLASGATASASSARSGMGADKVINGWNRIVGKDPNAWSPDPRASGPQWLKLQLPRPTKFDTMHITFARTSDNCRPQIRKAGDWKTIAEIKSGPVRRVVLNFPPMTTGNVRLLFDKPSRQTAVCEIRLYDEGK